MEIIQSHDVTLYGGSDIDIVLCPLTDAHLPLLYRWCGDPEVLYWSDTEEVEGYDQSAVQGIYGNVSRHALCFLITVNGRPVGEAWIQRMNIPQICALHPGRDVRRIDIAIGEKDIWGKGVGSAAVGMLVEYAFCAERADVLYGLVNDHNIRSQRTFLRNGFSKVDEIPLTQNAKTKAEYRFALDRQEFINRRRVKVPPEKRFMLPLSRLQPSQLYISEGKLRLVREWFPPARPADFDPIPIKMFEGKTLMTDGHTRAVAAHLAGHSNVPVYFDEDELDMRAYAMDIRWCEEAGIRTPVDLAERIVPHKEYERLWRKRCMEMEFGGG